MNYLDMVNDVLVRLRESEVTSVSDNSYSKLIGRYVNDIKRQVEDSYNWPVQYNTYSITTSNGTGQYTITNIGTRFKLVDVINATNYYNLDFIKTSELNIWKALPNQAKSVPIYFNFNQVDSNGDLKVNVWPIPDNTYTINFNVYAPQAPLVNNSDSLAVPYEPIILGAYAKALAERGEDGGLSSSEAYQLYRSSLADAIALQAAYNPIDTIWEAQ